MFLLRSMLLLPVLVYQSLFLALSQIWANKMRSVLTTIGIVIGVASVTAVIAALSGLKKNVLTEFESFGTNKVFIMASRPSHGPLRHASFQQIRLSPSDFDGMLDHCPSLRQLTRIASTSATVSFGEHSEPNVQISGIEPSWHDIEHRYVSIGRPFSLIDNEQARPVCLINSKLQEKLRLDRDCTGQSIMIGDRRFHIVGVVEERVESNMFRDGVSSSEILVPFRTVMQGRQLPIYVIATSVSPEVSEEAQAEVTFFLRRKRRLGLEDPNTFRVEFVEQFVQQFTRVAQGITMVATGVVGISLLVGGVGIMNIMLVSVSERTREIGLRKAVGARPSAILLQFLVEAVMLCLMGGLIGVLIGQAMTSALANIPNAQLEQAYIPGWAIVLAFSFAGGVGLVFGMFPAIKAARLDPIEALRHE